MTSFNPINSILGNGNAGQVTAAFSTGSSFWSITTNDLPGNALTGIFPNDQNPYSILQKSLSFTVPYRGGKDLVAPIHSKLPVGTIGVSAVGIIIHSPTTSIIATGNLGSRWTLNSVFSNLYGVDEYGGTVDSTGAYYYITPKFITNNAWTDIVDSYTQDDGHSKIIGWASDGYPIYGPYGYTNPLNVQSGTSLMVSGYVSSYISGRPSNRTMIVKGNVTSSTSFTVYSASGVGIGMIVTGQSIPGNTKILRIVGTQIFVNNHVTVSESGILTASYPLGIFLEDWSYSNTVGATLDQFNGRLCVTPEFPNGTYAYFSTVDVDGNPAYPYLVGPSFYGSLSADNTNSTLISLLPSVGNLVPSFSSTVTDYIVQVNNTNTSISFTALPNYANAVMILNTQTITSGQVSRSIPLLIGINTSTLTVTSQYKTTTTYIISVVRPKSGVNNLTSLTINPGILSPSFSPSVTSYYTTVTTSVTNLDVTAIKEYPLSNITINGTTATSGIPYNVSLNYGSNSYSIVVTAENSSVKTYTLGVTRLSPISLLSDIQLSSSNLTPTFNRDTFFYTVNALNTTTIIGIKCIAVDNLSKIYINNTLTPSGTYAYVNLNTGNNGVGIKVISSDQTTQHYYVVNVLRAYSSNANLTNLNLSVGTLSPAFNSTITNYTASVNNNVTSISVLSSSEMSESTITVDDIPVLPNQYSDPVSLFVGNNSIRVVVTAPDYVTKKTYTITVNRQPSTVALLSNLDFKDLTISPSFNTNTFSYSANATYETLSVNVTPTVLDTKSTVNVNNISVISGTSINFPISVGTNTVKTTVIAQDGITSSSYVTSIVRAKNNENKLFILELDKGLTLLTPGFVNTNTSYNATVPHIATSTSVVAVAQDLLSTISINGHLVTSGEEYNVPLAGSVVYNSYNNHLEWLSNTTITVVCTAQDTNFNKTYQVQVHRLPPGDSSLQSLFVTDYTISPAFSSNLREYYLMVKNSTKIIRVNAQGTNILSRVIINGDIFGNGHTYVNLAPGSNIIPIVCYAGDGTVTSYTLTVDRALFGRSNDASLSSLFLSTGTLSPSFVPNDIDPTLTLYSTIIDYSNSSIKVRPIASDSKSVIKVNGNIVTSGNFSASIDTPLGDTFILVTVKADDLVTTKNYGINVTRRGTSEARLKNLFVDSGALTPYFRNDIYEYTVEVNNYVEHIAFKPITFSTQEQVSLGGLGLVPGNWSYTSPINIGTNQFKLVVLAGDFITENIYTINIVRSASKTLDPVFLFLPKGTSYLEVTRNGNLGLLEIFTRDTTLYTKTGIFPNNKNTGTLALQDIGLQIPYKGGSSIASGSLVPRTAQDIIGMSIAGIPFYGPDSSTTVTGRYGTTWTLNSVEGAYTGDEFGGNLTPEGLYYYSDLRFILNDGWGPLFGRDKNEYSIPRFSTRTQPPRKLTGAYKIPVNWLNDWNSYVGPINLPFSWNMFGTTYTNLYVGTAGYLTFGGGETGYWPPGKTGILPASAIYMICQDLLIGPWDQDEVLSNGEQSGIFQDIGTLGQYNYYRIRYQATHAVTKNIVNFECTLYSDGKNQFVEVVYETIDRDPYSLGTDGVEWFALGITRQGSRDSNGNIISFGTGASVNQQDVLDNSSHVFYSSAATGDWTYVGAGSFRLDNILGDYSNDDGHSKIVGFALDGYPIYGPFGYTIPDSPIGGIQAMVSGYVSRELPDRPIETIVTTTDENLGNTVYIEYNPDVKVGMVLTSSFEPKGLRIVRIDGNKLIFDRSPSIVWDGGSIFNASYPVGTFIEDYTYIKLPDTTLDEHNGRYCVTPEFPFGTYAYFLTEKDGAPSYPYIIGNYFYGDTTVTPIVKTEPPSWVTNKGSLDVAVELSDYSVIVNASGSNTTYKIITGKLPNGLLLNSTTGEISGNPTSVYEATNYSFIIRATNEYGIADRKFSIEVIGATPPIITTPAPYLHIGPSGETFLINKQFVDLQFTATADVIPEGKSLLFYIADGDGELPPGLTLTTSGRLHGQVQDKLSLFYQAASNGAYDEEGYDFNPYEHESQQAFGVSDRFINKVYGFYLSVSNGLGVVREKYEIEVNDPKTSLTFGNYPIAPQFITPSDLGSIRSNTYQIIKIETYDCDPGSGPITYDWAISNYNISELLPKGLTLEPSTGIISGFLKYSPTFSETYTFNVRVLKTDQVLGLSNYRDKKFTLTILGSVLSSLEFTTGELVGTLSQGEQSELSIVAIPSDPTLVIHYTLTSGELPPGLTLSIDGSIQGKIDYNISEVTTRTYSFVVTATDNRLTNQIRKSFSIIVNGYKGIQYTKIILHPLLPKSQRVKFDSFINDQNIFDQSMLYRPYDIAFGTQKNLEFVLEYGIGAVNLTDYASQMQNFFSRRSLYFGELKSAIAKDSAGNIIYEAIYIEIVDKFVNREGTSISNAVYFDNTVLYPNSIDNMRGALESITSIDDTFLPKFMRTVQDNSGIPLGRVLCITLCYCLPGNSTTIIRKIQEYGVDFKDFNFDIDRITVLNSLDSSSAKYLLFPNREA